MIVKYHNWVLDDSVGVFNCVAFERRKLTEKDYCPGCGKSISSELLEVFNDSIKGRDRLLDLIADYHFRAKVEQPELAESMEVGESA